MNLISLLLSDGCDGTGRLHAVGNSRSSSAGFTVRQVDDAGRQDGLVRRKRSFAALIQPGVAKGRNRRVNAIAAIARVRVLCLTLAKQAYGISWIRSERDACPVGNTARTEAGRP